MATCIASAIGITPAIGLMLLNIGFGSNAGVYSEKGGPFYVLSSLFLLKFFVIVK